MPLFKRDYRDYNIVVLLSSYKPLIICYHVTCFKFKMTHNYAIIFVQEGVLADEILVRHPNFIIEEREVSIVIVPVQD